MISNPILLDFTQNFIELGLDFQSTDIAIEINNFFSYKPHHLTPLI